MATLETQEYVGSISPAEVWPARSCTATSWFTRCLAVTAAILFISLALIPNGATRIYQWPWSFAASLLAAAPIALLFLNRFARRTSLGGDANLLFALLAALVVVSAMASRFAAQSLDVSILALGMIATVFCTAGYLTSGDASEKSRRLQRWIGTLGVLFALTSLFGWLYGDLALYDLKVDSVNALAGEEILEFGLFDVRNQSPLGHSNYTAGLALLVLPWLIGLAISRRRLERVFWTAASALVGFVLFTSGSRGALLGVAAIFACVLGFMTVRRSTGTKALIGFSLLAAVGVGLLAFSQPRIRNLATDWNQTGALNAGDQQRWSMLQAGLRMGADHPIIGQGPGITPLTYPSYRAGLDGGVESALQLHSMPVQIWADLGMLGVVLVSGLVFVATRRLWHFARAGTSVGATAGYGTAVASATCSTAGYLAFSLTDFQLDVPVFAGLLAANLGIIFGLTRIQNHHTNKFAQKVGAFRIRPCVAALAAILIASPVLWTTAHATLARRAHSAAVDRLERGDCEGFATGVREAIRWAPHNAFYRTSAGLGMLRLSFQGTGAQASAALRNDAIAFFEGSLVVQDDQEIAHFNLGWLLLPTDPERAGQHFRSAADLVPDKGGVYLGRGLACHERGDSDGALTGFALEIVNDPVFATAPFWDIPDFESLRRPAIDRAISILETLANDPQLRYLHLRTITREVAILLNDLVTEGPSGELLRSRSKIALDVAGTTDVLRSAAINTRLVRLRHRKIPPETLDAYRALFDRTGPDPKAILADPTGREAPLMRQSRRERPGYGILMRNLDVPLPLDAYFIQENAIVRDFFPDLFPAKGYLPTPLLVRIVQEEGGTSG